MNNHYVPEIALDLTHILTHSGMAGEFPGFDFQSNLVLSYINNIGYVPYM